MFSRRTLIGSALATTALDLSAAEKPGPVANTRFAFEARVTVASPLVVGEAPHGLRRVVAITGGTFEGPRIRGKVVPGGADWQFVRPDGVLSVEAKYTLEASDGALIMVTNRGMRHGPPEVIQKLARGEAVDPSSYYFRTVAEFEVALDSPHAWLNRAMFIGVAARQASAAIIRFHEIL
jgi:uncharacterized protein DUF3237